MIILGTGAGTTSVYSRQPSSSFVLINKGDPVLLCDVGYGVTFACVQLIRRVPRNIYVSHNHGDHSGDLPVLLAVESREAAAEGRPPPCLYSHPDVMEELQQYRLRELKSTGKPLEDFAEFHEVPTNARTAIGYTGLSISPFRTRHKETCYGFILYHGAVPVLGWTADSGFDEALYEQLSVAPVLLVDARKGGSEEHSGFDELVRLVALPYMQGKALYVTGYGRQDEVPKKGEVPRAVIVARPGMRIRLSPEPKRKDINQG
ncbi:hypothetical protein VaNZ11_009018 [Volvox africanus]|uniref:Metallo-beta-lactamase domain-containing protein n=1 Tax=Volvox africanus TaxID=51714 RepID=A0ABQ5S7E2_9CHLO|nr:hypothetical protein VaNZ11_009018 [Volvox africanus]